jgi:hypothetical protein
MAKVIAMNGGSIADDKSRVFVRSVQKSLDDWCDWAPNTTRGTLTPEQLLAVVLWAIQNETTSPEDEALIIEGWAQALSAVMSKLPALHPVTLLPLDKRTAPKNWVISIVHAQEFLDAMPIGFNLDIALEHFRVEAAKQLEKGRGGAPYADVLEQRKKAIKGAPWTREQLALVAEQVKARGIKAVAGELGISRQSLTTALQRPRDQLGPAKRANALLR